MDEQQIKALLHKYVNGSCSELEKAKLETWYLQQEIPRKLDLTEDELDAELSKVWESLEEEDEEEQDDERFLWKRLTIAASILFVLGMGFYFYRTDRAGHVPVTETRIAANDLKQDEHTAVYINPDGEQQELKGNDAFKAPVSNKHASSETEYHTVIIPRGGQHQIVLADGTHVWLNAASSLKYPNTFNGEQRVVELTGEAYFEVAHMPDKPFRVISRNQVVEVLGTHFNVNAYDDEPFVKTTLLEGSVEIRKDNVSPMVLKPGEQAVNSHELILKKNVNVEEAIAWKNGFFYFEEASLASVLRELARWYDLKIAIEEIPQKQFNGVLSKQTELSKVLTMIEKTSGLKFKVQEGRISMLK